jgi:hypothetical protein
MGIRRSGKAFSVIHQTLRLFQNAGFKTAQVAVVIVQIVDGTLEHIQKESRRQIYRCM